jgi:hypothetical protein
MWTKRGTVFTAAQGEYDTVYWPWILDRQQYPALSASFAGRYVTWYSTDHGAGGIAVAVADDPAGPWTNHGQVFNDLGPGFSTETPSVWWDGSKFRMFYQQAGAAPPALQSTLQATSPDGLTWTKLGQDAGIIVAPGAWPGDGHTGYAIPLHGPGLREMHAYHLLGGGNYPHFGMSVSENSGATWRTDPRPLLYGMDQLAPVCPGYRIEWNSGHPFDVDGQRWWVGLASSFGSGGGAVARHLIQAPLSDDGRRLVGVPAKVFPADAASNLRSLFVLDGRWLYYQIDDTIYLAERA